MLKKKATKSNWLAAIQSEKKCSQSVGEKPPKNATLKMNWKIIQETQKVLGKY